MAQVAHFVRASLAAYENACRHLEASEVLLASGHCPQAASLAVIGEEEIGKALLLILLAGGGLAPDAEHRVLGLIRGGPNSHRIKQLVSLVGLPIEGLLPYLLGPVEQLGAVDFGDLNRWQLGKLLVRLVNVEAPRLRQVLEVAGTQYVSSIERDAIEVYEGQSWQRIRDRGLYVDLTPEGIREPSAITFDAATSHIERLRRLTVALRPWRAVAGTPDPVLETVMRIVRRLSLRLRPAVPSNEENR